MKDRVRDITKRSGGRSIASVIGELRGYLVGWKNYFQLADTPGIFSGLARRIAGNGRRWWVNSGKAIKIAFPVSYFDGLGLPRLAASSTR